MSLTATIDEAKSTEGIGPKARLTSAAWTSCVLKRNLAI